MLLLAVAGAACFAGAALLQPRLLHMRAEGQPAAIASLRDAPPLVVFTTVGIGAFRGIAVDILWARVDQLAAAGNHVETIQLAEWITALEPKLPDVWDFQAFNLAYNVSNMIGDPAERWRWVRVGMGMLRDRAIPLNPDSGMLYASLCRLYRNKLIDGSDKAQNFYRVAWADEMTALLGGRTAPDYAALRSDAEQTRRMGQEYGLDPDLMRQIDELYGPFDWRLPEPHVIYWARRGATAATRSDVTTFDGLTAEAVAGAFLAGRVSAFDQARAVLDTEPRPELLEKAIRAYDEFLSRNDLPADINAPAGYSYLVFLRRALTILHGIGRTEDAKRVFELLRDKLRDPACAAGYERYITESLARPPPEAPFVKEREEILREEVERHEHPH